MFFVLIDPITNLLNTGTKSRKEKNFKKRINKMSENQSGVWPFKLLRRQFYTDWIFWLWLISLLGVLLPAINTISRNDSSEFNLSAGAIDFLIGFIVQTIVFLAIPGGLRKRTSRNRLLEVEDFDATDFTFLTELKPPSIRELEGRPITQPHWLADPAKHYDERMWDGGKWSRQVRQTDGADFWQLRRPAEAAVMQSPSSRLETNANAERSPTEPVIRQVDSQNIVADLKELTTLFDRGALTIDEFKAAKERILGTGSANE